MNNRFSDIDKAIIAAWLLFGAGVGAFVAPLFRVGSFISGTIGLFMGAGVAYVLFFKPWHRRVGSFEHPQETDDPTEEDEETDISEFIHDSFKAEGIDLEANVEFIPSEEDADEEELIDEENDENEISVDLEEELEEDELEGESLEEDLQFDETEEEDLQDEDEFEEQGTLPAFYTSSSQIHSPNEDDQDTEPSGLKALVTPTQLPITIAALWLFVSGYLFSKSPELAQWIEKYFSVSFFIIMPVLFLIGLSGMIGILFRERDETLEIPPQENMAYLLNLLKIFLGWGIVAYAILVNL